MVDVVVQIFGFFFYTVLWRLSPVICWFIGYVVANFVFVFVRRGWSPAVDSLWDIYAMFFFTFGWISPAVKYESRSLLTFILTISMFIDGLGSTLRFWKWAGIDRLFDKFHQQDRLVVRMLNKFYPVQTTEQIKK